MFINEGLMDCNAPLTQGLTDFLKDSEVLSPFFMNFIYTANATGSNNLRQLLEMEVAWRQQETYGAMLNLILAINEISDSLKQQEFKYLVDQEIRESEREWLADWFSHYDLTQVQSQLAYLSTNMQMTWNILQNSTDSLSAADELTLYSLFLDEEEDMGWALLGLNLHNKELLWPIFDMSSWENKSNINNDKKPHSSSLSSSNELGVYPNPFTEILRFTYTLDLQDKGLIQIFDAKGAIVQTLKTNTTGISELKTKDWARGVYAANLIFENHLMSNVKFIKR